MRAQTRRVIKGDVSLSPFRPDPSKTTRAVLFDLDGTLTRPYLDFDAIRAELSIENREPVLEAMERMDADRRARAEAVVARHEAEAAANSELHDGVHETLEALRNRGIRLALLTRNSRQSVATVLRKHGLRFDFIRTREDGRTKPSPEPVLAVCRSLEVAPAATVSVGDFLFDIEAGRAAGAATVLMIGDGPRPPYADRADHVIRRLLELVTIVDARGAKGEPS